MDMYESEGDDKSAKRFLDEIVTSLQIVSFLRLCNIIGLLSLVAVDWFWSLSFPHMKNNVCHIRTQQKELWQKIALLDTKRQISVNFHLRERIFRRSIAVFRSLNDISQAFKERYMFQNPKLR